MRKYKREMLRREAERNNFSPSKYVRFAWDTLQKKLVGENIRQRNQARGTHKKRTWRARITAAVRLQTAVKAAITKKDEA